MGLIAAGIIVAILIYAFWHDTTGQVKKKSDNKKLAVIGNNIKSDWYRNYLYENYSIYQYLFSDLIETLSVETFDDLFSSIDVKDLKNKEVIYRINEDLSNTLGDIWERKLNKFIFVVLCIQYAKADILERSKATQSWIATVIAREGHSFFPDNKFYTNDGHFDY